MDGCLNVMYSHIKMVQKPYLQVDATIYSSLVPRPPGNEATIHSGSGVLQSASGISWYVPQGYILVHVQEILLDNGHVMYK